MVLRTKTKLALAHSAQRVLMAGRRVVRLGHTARCRRGGLQWNLDLREGVDFAIFLFGSFEPKMIAAYRRMIPPGSTVLDIGANIGAHTAPLGVCVGPTGRVVAVEPTRYGFERLEEHLRLNPGLVPRVTAVQAMLMSNRQAPLAHKIEASWPLQTPENAHAGHAGVGKETTGAAVTTVDAMTSDLGLKDLNFVKLDVDGYEVEVLRGGRETLHRFRPTIFLEYAPSVIAEKGYDPEEMIAILRESGYVFSDLNARLLGRDGKKLPAVPAGAGVNLIAHLRT